MWPMSVEVERDSLPQRERVVLLYNVDSSLTPQEAAECMQEVDEMESALRREFSAVERAEVQTDVAAALQEIDPREAVIFNWCEGIDGRPVAYDLVAGVLDELGYAYTGSDAWTLRHTQNKSAFKTILDAWGVATPDWRVCASPRDASDWTTFPAIVKPVAEHSSVGLTVDSVVDDSAGLVRQIEHVMDTWGEGALLEEYIAGRELYASIWGNGAPEVLPLHEVDFNEIEDPKRRFVDYEAKWQTESFRYRHMPERYPSTLDGAPADRVRAAAIAAYRALRCRDYARMDLRMRDSDGMPFVIDVNPNCDITLEAGFTKTAQVAGYDYSAMLARIVAWASQRLPARVKQEGAR